MTTDPERRALTGSEALPAVGTPLGRAAPDQRMTVSVYPSPDDVGSERLESSIRPHVERCGAVLVTDARTAGRLEVEGTVAQLECVFGVRLQRYQWDDTEYV